MVLLLGLPLKPLLANGGKMIIYQDTVLTQDFQGSIEDGPEPFNNPVAPEEIYNDKDALVVGSHLNYIAYYLEFAKSLLFRIYSPVEVEITDPQGKSINKEKNEIPEAAYIIDDLDGDGEYEDTIAIAQRLSGDYLIKITPQPGASPDDTYTLKVAAGNTEIILADNLPISSIPPAGQFFTLHSTDSTINGISVNQNSADPPIHGSFYDTENSEGNSFSAGILDFSLNSPQDNFGPRRDVALNIMPGDSVTREIKVENLGSLSFQYTASTAKILGDDDFCAGLQLIAKLNGETKYDGGLMDFELSKSVEISGPEDNWFFITYLPYKSNFVNQVCQFKFVFKGWQDNAENYEESGFKDIEEISSHLASWGLRINEVEYDTFQPGTDKDNEWFELYNQTNTSFTLINWTITDNTETDSIPELTIGPQQFAVVAATASGFATNYPGFIGTIVYISDGEIGNGLSNTGDRLVLKRAAGVEIDAVSWLNNDYAFGKGNGVKPATGAGHSIARKIKGLDTDLPDDWQKLITPNPGTNPHNNLDNDLIIVNQEENIIEAPVNDGNPPLIKENQQLQENILEENQESEIMNQGEDFVDEESQSTTTSTDLLSEPVTNDDDYDDDSDNNNNDDSDDDNEAVTIVQEINLLESEDEKSSESEEILVAETLTAALPDDSYSPPAVSEGNEGDKL